jgi:ribosomal protein L11 methyltransferase
LAKLPSILKGEKMSSPHFYVLYLPKLDPELEPEITSILMRSGCLGTEEKLLFTQPNLQLDPKIIKQKTKHLLAYFEQAPDPELIDVLSNTYELRDLRVEQQAHQDWLAEWKKGYHSFVLTEPFWVVPSWEELPAAPEHCIRIDPGMAFGTGTHATTQMAAHLLQAVVQRQNPLPKTMLDVGCGTGILGILGEKLGISWIHGIDIDPECIRVATENAALNHCQNLLIDDTPIKQIKERFDVVVANIIDGVLRKYSSILKERSNRYLILSGILVENEEMTLDHFINEEWRLIKRLESPDSWVAVLLEKSGA